MFWLIGSERDIGFARLCLFGVVSQIILFCMFLYINVYITLFSLDISFLINYIYNYKRNKNIEFLLIFFFKYISI